MKHLKIIQLSLFILLLGINSYAQWKPSSIYTGITGLYDALNFSFPIGSEWQYKQVSFEAALVIVSGGIASVSHFPFYQHFDFDLGVKYYLGKGVFTGLNYGYVDGPLYSVNAEYGTEKDEEGAAKLRGITWSLGYRFTINKKLYVSAFVGLTFRHSYEQFEHRFFGRTPAEFTSFREGITIGYKL